MQMHAISDKWFPIFLSLQQQQQHHPNMFHLGLNSMVSNNIHHVDWWNICFVHLDRHGLDLSGFLTFKNIYSIGIKSET